MKRSLFTIIGVVLYLSLFSQTKDTICQSYNLYIDSTNSTLETYVYKNCISQELYMLAGANFLENDSTYHQSIDSIEIKWIIDDTIIIYGNPLIYNFDDYGVHIIKYNALDQFDCSSETEITYYQNYSEIDFSDISLSDDTVSLGDTVNLLGVNLSYSLSNDYSLSPICIPDSNNGTTIIPFIDTLSIVGYGLVINSFEDIPEICLNIEHSFLGDLNIELVCPNGQAVTLHEFTSGGSGGGTFLGEPIDDDMDTTAGIGYDYCWSTNPIYNTMTEESINYSTLPQGSYQSNDDLSNFIGCPFDGAWILIIEDHWASDNGFLLGWEIGNNNSNSQFDYYIFNNIENNDTVIPSVTGVNEYNLEIHQGTCVYDTVLSVFVQSGLYVNESINSEISIFPNPAKDILNINGLMKESSTLYVYDLSGQVLMINELNEINNKVNISILSKGIYYCKVLGSENYIFKLIVD